MPLATAYVAMTKSAEFASFGLVKFPRSNLRRRVLSIVEAFTGVSQFNIIYIIQIYLYHVSFEQPGIATLSAIQCNVVLKTFYCGLNFYIFIFSVNKLNC